MSLKSLKNKLFVAFGFITLSLGILGIFLPLLPTTPFLLLASTLFMHGSKRWHSWLTNHSLFGPFIHNYVNHKAITLSMKITILITLWLSLIFSMFIIKLLITTIILTIVGVAVTAHIFYLRTKKKEDTQ